MFKMRKNLRRLTITTVALVTIWFLVSRLSLLEVPTSAPPQNKVVDLEDRLDKLQVKMDQQLSDSNNLLAKVKQHLKKNVHEEVKEMIENEIDIEGEFSCIPFSFIYIFLELVYNKSIFFLTFN